MQIRNGHVGKLVDVAAIDTEEKRGLLQARAFALGTSDHVREPRCPFLRCLRSAFGLFKNEGDDPFELNSAIAEADVARDAQGFVKPVQERGDHIVVHLFNRRVQVIAEVGQHGFHLFEDP